LCRSVHAYSVDRGCTPTRSRARRYRANPTQPPAHGTDLEWRGCRPPTGADVSPNIPDLSRFGYIRPPPPREEALSHSDLPSHEKPPRSYGSHPGRTEANLVSAKSSWQTDRIRRSVGSSKLGLRQEILATSDFLADFLLQALLHEKGCGVSALPSCDLGVGKCHPPIRDHGFNRHAPRTDVRIRTSRLVPAVPATPRAIKILFGYF